MQHFSRSCTDWFDWIFSVGKERLVLKYSVNFENMGAAFAVPAAVVDQHLRLCGVLQLKVLLLLLRQGRPMTDQEIGSFLRQDPADVRDAALYWENCGLLRSEGGEVAACPVNPETVVAAPVRELAQEESRRTVVASDSRRFTRAECAELAAKDSTLLSLLHKAQEITGCPLTSMDMQCLTALYAYYGLTPEFILTVMGYCRSVDKLNMRYVEKTAASWQEKGIETAQEAERYIDYLTQQRSNEGQVRSAFGINDRNLTTREREMIASWYGELGFGIDVIRLAYERAVENTGKLSFAYINKVLQNWHREGVRTAADAANASARRAPAQEHGTSYSIQEIEDRMLSDFIDR